MTQRCNDDREYRFVSKKGATKWRPVPKDGVGGKPMADAHKLLGEAFNLELRPRHAVGETVMPPEK